MAANDSITTYSHSNEVCIHLVFIRNATIYRYHFDIIIFDNFMISNYENAYSSTELVDIFLIVQCT